MLLVSFLEGYVSPLWCQFGGILHPGGLGHPGGSGHLGHTHPARPVAQRTVPSHFEFADNSTAAHG